MTREVANWFHDNEGELFTVDETPFSREEIVQIVNDSVDPVQQVMVEGEKYIGVISFEEHDGWYEYTRWDDAAGEVSIGVCAACVKEREAADGVARTLGDPTDVAREKMEQHYAESHTVRPAEIETGATLLSGTTINGNEAIHPGMDGHGSGVDADLVEGSEALQAGSFYVADIGSPGDVQKQFTSPSIETDGVGSDSADSIWITSINEIYETNQSGSIVTQFQAPSLDVRGIDSDSSDCLWHANSATNTIYKLNASNGSVISQFSSPSYNPFGVGLDSSDSIWHGDGSFNESVYELNQSGTVQSGFNVSATPVGVGVDGNDSIWVTLASDDVIKFNNSGSSILSFTYPKTQPRGAAITSDNSVWIGDRTDDSIYGLQQNNTVKF